jgi:diguanylate cyclase (GGDEF)-like protein
MLGQLARLIDESVRESDVVARYGGEEFLVVMPETDLAGAATFADRLRARIANDMPLTVSGGVAEALDGDTAESIIARADAALYSAKSAGRNCIFSHSGDGSKAVTAEVPVLL